MRKLTFEKKITLKPIGFVRTKAVNDEVKDKTRLSEIFLDCELTKALKGITDFSHVFVLFWLHEITAKQRETLKVHPRGRQDLPLVGVFASRTNLRANPIGLTLCELLKVESNVLTVRGLDAFDGTPVLDIKPYDSWDCALNAKMPDWWLKLEAEKKEQKNSEKA
jgi:tRNA-Thr(GGU) m(6)t(6)A37 methyltransferase TsaA